MRDLPRWNLCRSGPSRQRRCKCGNMASSPATRLRGLYWASHTSHPWMAPRSRQKTKSLGVEQSNRDALRRLETMGAVFHNFIPRFRAFASWQLQQFCRACSCHTSIERPPPPTMRASRATLTRTNSPRCSGAANSTKKPQWPFLLLPLLHFALNRARHCLLGCRRASALVAPSHVEATCEDGSEKRKRHINPIAAPGNVMSSEQKCASHM